jgi:hypothetical protein
MIVDLRAVGHSAHGDKRDLGSLGTAGTTNGAIERCARSVAGPVPSHRPATALLAWLALLGLGPWSAACAPTIKRDLSKIPAGQVGFDDMCGLQSYFDDIEARKEPAPILVSSTEFETQRGGHALRSGRSRFGFEGRAQIFTLRRVLDENWDRLPEAVVVSPRVDLDVYWSERDGLRRVVSNRNATLIASSNGQDFPIPYHVCLSELIYGAPLYHARREVMGLGPIMPASQDAVPVPPSSRDGGTASAVTSPAAGSDGGAGGTAGAGAAPGAGTGAGTGAGAAGGAGTAPGTTPNGAWMPRPPTP